MKHAGTIRVEKDRLTEFDRLCAEPAGDTGEGEVIFDEEFTFADGNRMAVQVVASLSPSTEPCWTQGVIFAPDGTELGCTDCGETLSGEFCVTIEDTDYVVNVLGDNDA